MTGFQKIKEFFIRGDLKETVQRFPLSIACAVLCFFIGLSLIHDLIEFNDDFIARLIVSCIVGFFWFTAVQLYRENHIISNITFLAAAFAGLISLVVIIFWEDSGIDFSVRLISIIISLFLLVTVVPYAFFKSDDLSYWSYNRKVSFGISIAFLAAVILFLGASAALASLKYLFEVRISSDVYSTLWLFCATILGPVYGLCFIPRIFKEDPQECTMPTQVGFMANWILAPLVAVYIAILYAYFAKIAFTGEIPKGQLAYMIAGFATAGIFTYLVSWPFVYDGKANKLLASLMKWFFPLLILPAAVQFYAIFLRVDQYGVTEKRYIVVVMALWFSFLALGFTLKKLQLKHIILSLVAILFLSSWGPWGMFHVSYLSQSGRLENLLVENDLLDGDKIIKTNSAADVPFEARQNISSIVMYLSRQYRHDEAEEVLYGYKNQSEFFDALGFEPVSRYQQDDLKRQIENNTFRFHTTDFRYNRVIDVQKADYYIQDFAVYKTNEREFKLDDEKSITARLEDGKLFVSFFGQEDVIFDLMPAIEKILADNPAREPLTEPYVLDIAGKGFSMRYHISNIAGDIEDQKPVVSNLVGQAFITLR